MNDQKSKPGGWAARQKRTTLRLGYWTGAWLATMAIAIFGSLLVWESNQVLTLFTILVNLAIGVGMIYANKDHLQDLDEMQRTIHLEAMALALGVGLVFGLSYSALDVTNIIEFDAEISHLVFLISITYGIGITRGRRRYE